MIGKGGKLLLARSLDRLSGRACRSLGGLAGARRDVAELLPRAFLCETRFLELAPACLARGAGGLPGGIGEAAADRAKRLGLALRIRKYRRQDGAKREPAEKRGFGFGIDTFRRALRCACSALARAAIG